MAERPIYRKMRDNERELMPETGTGFIDADTAICSECLKEMLDPFNRRYMYPFISCNNCGPRFTVVDATHDEIHTSIKSHMCPECIKEWNNPLDRRYHAKTVSCKSCGPKICFEEMDKTFWAEEAIQKAVELLNEGNILALKGIGGYHLAVDARNDHAVSRLRTKKLRYSKPFAVMMGKIGDVERHCGVSPEEKSLLHCKQTPIVLLKINKNTFNLSKNIAPGLDTIGVMLPYSPLHHIILNRTGFPLVMTSANISDEPLEKDDVKARDRLRDIVDGFLVHERPIVNRIDDSVCFFGAGEKRTVRRGRGSAPTPLILDKKSMPILACGAHNKNTFCLLKDEYAFLSHHIGDLGNVLTLKYYKEEVDKYKKLFKIDPVWVAKDLHPGYLSSIYADEINLPVIGVQHHHAHIASVMAEYGVVDKVLGIAYDGTGLGSDGNIWGAEFLLADLKGFQRVGQLSYAPLPGGDAAIKSPFRGALGFIYAYKDEFREYIHHIGRNKAEMIFMQIEKKLNTPLCSSMGRLFDVVASIVNLRDFVDFEGQAAMELEAIILQCDGYYAYDIEQGDSSFHINVEKLLKGIYRDYTKGINPGIISAKFHNTIIKFTTELTIRIRDKYRTNKVVLSGGCFQNKYLLEGLDKELLKNSFEVLIPSIVPINDEGISLGQAIIAREQIISGRVL